MKEWWQVYYFDYNKDNIICFGFASIDGYITDHPDWTQKHQTLQSYKKELKKLPYLQVIKIV